MEVGTDHLPRWMNEEPSRLMLGGQLRCGGKRSSEQRNEIMVGNGALNKGVG